MSAFEIVLTALNVLLVILVGLMYRDLDRYARRGYRLRVRLLSEDSWESLRHIHIPLSDIEGQVDIIVSPGADQE